MIAFSWKLISYQNYLDMSIKWFISCQSLRFQTEVMKPERGLIPVLMDVMSSNYEYFETCLTGCSATTITENFTMPFSRNKKTTTVVICYENPSRLSYVIYIVHVSFNFGSKVWKYPCPVIRIYRDGMNQNFRRKLEYYRYFESKIS